MSRIPNAVQVLQGMADELTAAGYVVPMDVIARGLAVALQVDVSCFSSQHKQPMSDDWAAEMTNCYLKHLVRLASSISNTEMFSGAPFEVRDLHPNVVTKAAGTCRNFAQGSIAEFIRAGNLTPEQVGEGLARAKCGLSGFLDYGLAPELAEQLERRCKPFGLAELHRATVNSRGTKAYSLTPGVIYDHSVD